MGGKPGDRIQEMLPLRWVGMSAELKEAACRDALSAGGDSTCSAVEEIASLLTQVACITAEIND